MFFKKLIILFSLFVFSISSNAEEIKTKDLCTEFIGYTRMFDFSDEGKK